MAEAQPLALFACYLIVHPLRAENEVRARHHLHCAFARDASHQPMQAYVALSRVTGLDGLFIRGGAISQA